MLKISYNYKIQNTYTVYMLPVREVRLARVPRHSIW
jgi:hypothetical protein